MVAVRLTLWTLYYLLVLEVAVKRVVITVYSV